MDKCPITGLACPYKKYIHVTEVSNLQATEIKDMCAFCGLPYIAKEGGPELDPKVNKFFEMINSAIKNINIKKLQPMDVIKPHSCPMCGYILKDILITGKVGCGNCYNFYKKELLPFIEKCQFGATQHKGKKPKKLFKSLQELEAELKVAIEKEDYEKASILKDEIKKLTFLLP